MFFFEKKMIILLIFYSFVSAIKCVSCVGRGCMTNACDSDVCVASYYAANWNEGRVLKS